MSVVVVNGVSKAFGSVTALRDISFEIGSGEVLGLLGPNGAGKTTMVDILSTLTRPDRGHAHIAGHDVVADPAGVRRSIMLTGQQVAVDNLLTGRQNLVMFGRLQGLGEAAARARATELIREFDLSDAADRRVDTYSGGMRRRIDIACGLVVIPRVAFLVALYMVNTVLVESTGLIVMLLVFFCTGFVPLDQYPTLIQPVVEHQPMSYAVEAMRGLALGGPVLTPLIGTLLWSTGIAAACAAPLFIGYRKASMR